MSVALQSEIIKVRRSNSLKIAFFAPFIFLLFTLLTLLTSQNHQGTLYGVIIIQSNILNQWTVIVLAICIVLLVSSDYHQEQQALGIQHALANNWPLPAIFFAKSIKTWLLLGLTHLVLAAVIIVSNLLTARLAGNVSLILLVLLAIWISSLPLIVINMVLLTRLNVILVGIVNFLATLGSVFTGLVLGPWFWLDPWAYAARLAVLLRTNPNGNALPATSYLVNSTSFIYAILAMVTLWLLVDLLIAKTLGRGNRHDKIISIGIH